MRINGVVLTDGERGIFGKASDRARRKYLADHGSMAVPVPAGVKRDGKGWAAHIMAVREHGAAWRAEHGEAYEAVAQRAGEAAVKRFHAARVKSGYGPAAERLAVLGLTATRSRKRAAAPVVPAELQTEHVPVSVADIARESDGRVIVAHVTAGPPATPPEAVPAAMPAMTRAARKQSNRELAERMRAAGIEPRGDAWRRAVDGESLDSIARDVAAVTS